jgi:hypothetical protein
MRRLMMIGLLCGLCLVGGRGEAAAQTVCPASSPGTTTNPTHVCFTNVDFAAPVGAATGYRVEFYAGGSDPVQTADVARSVVIVAGAELAIPFSALPAYPVGQVFTVKVRTVRGTEATVVSNPSGPFGRSGPLTAPTSVRVVSSS